MDRVPVTTHNNIRKITVELEDGTVVDMKRGVDFVSGYFRLVPHYGRMPSKVTWMEGEIRVRGKDEGY